MANEDKKVNKGDGTVYFVLVPKVGAAMQNLQIIANQRVAKIENGIQVEPAKTDILSPNGQGLFVLNPDNPEHQNRLRVLKLYMERNNHEGQPPVMIGPFDTVEKAFSEMDRVRPKTDAESAAREKARNDQLEEQLEAQNSELAELRKKIEAAQKTSKA